MNSTTVDSSSAAAPRPEPIHTHIRGSSLLLVGRQISLLLNLAVQVLTVRYLTKAEYGAFAYALAFVTPGASLLALGLGKALSRFVPIYQEREEHAKVVGAVLVAVGTVLALGSVAVLSVVGLGRVLLQSAGADPLAVSLLLILIVLCPTEALELLFRNLLAVFANARAIFFRRHVLGPCLKLAVVLLLVGAHANVRFLAVGYLVAGFLSTATSAVLIIQIFRVKGLFRRSLLRQVSLPWREILGFSLPLLSFDVVQSLRSFATILFLGHFHSLEAVAVFRAVLPIAKLNEVVSESFRLLFTPAVARFFAREDRVSMERLYWQTAMWVSLLTFPVFAVTFSLAEPLSVFLFGQAYAGAGGVLAILSLGYFLQASVGFNTLTLRVVGSIRLMLGIDLVTASISLVMSLLLIPPYGAIGGALALCGALVIQNVLYQWALARVTGIDAFPARYRAVYSKLLIALLSLQVIGAIVDVSLITGLILAAIASVLVFWVNRDCLDIQKTFPEVQRVPFVRQLLGAPIR